MLNQKGTWKRGKKHQKSECCQIVVWLYENF